MTMQEYEKLKKRMSQGLTKDQALSKMYEDRDLTKGRWDTTTYKRKD